MGWIENGSVSNGRQLCEQNLNFMAGNANVQRDWVRGGRRLTQQLYTKIFAQYTYYMLQLKAYNSKLMTKLVCRDFHVPTYKYHISHADNFDVLLLYFIIATILRRNLPNQYRSSEDPPINFFDKIVSTVLAQKYYRDLFPEIIARIRCLEIDARLILPYPYGLHIGKKLFL